MTHPALREEEEYVMPCGEAVLAGTLALMTGYAQAACPGQRIRMAGKIAANLRLLAGDLALDTPFRVVVERMQQAWETLAAPSQGRLWHAPHPFVQ